MIERYSHEKHRHLIEAWLGARGMAVPVAELIYDTGFVVDGIAVGFLCKTNSKTAYVDQVATQPGLPEKKREAAIQTLLDAIESEARSLGFWQIAALNESLNMLNRFTGRGYSSVSRFTLVCKSLLPNTEKKVCLG